MVLRIVEPNFTEAAQSRQTFLCLESRTDNFLNKDASGRIDRGELQVLFRSKVSKQAALAHACFRRQPANSQAVQSFY